MVESTTRCRGLGILNVERITVSCSLLLDGGEHDLVSWSRYLECGENDLLSCSL